MKKAWSRSALVTASMLAVSSIAVVGGSGVAQATTRSHVTYAKTLACEVTDTGGKNDKSFNASAFLGLSNAAKLSKNITTKVESTPPNGTESTYDSEIATFVNDKCNVIITVGFLMSDATWNAVVANPKIHFAQVDNPDASPGNDGVANPPYTGSEPNYLGLTYSTQQDAFLGGYEAAAYAASVNPNSPKVATYGGLQFSSVTYYMDGYYDGVQYYNSTVKPKHDVQVLGWNEKTQTGTFIGSFTDTADASTDTTAFLNEGATTVFPVAGSDGLGTTAAVKTWNGSHSVKANVEWVDTDGCVSDAADCSIFLNSVTKGVTASVTAAVVAQATGAFKGGNYVGTLANGGAAFVQDSGTAAKTVTAKTLAAIKTITAGIEKGTIKVAVGGK